MVKRQTVWLSTMMVLSLMLIGYYTMNNGTPGAPGTASVTTRFLLRDTRSLSHLGQRAIGFSREC